VASNGGTGCGTSFDAPTSGLQQHRTAAGLKKVTDSLLSAAYRRVLDFFLLGFYDDYAFVVLSTVYDCIVYVLPQWRNKE